MKHPVFKEAVITEILWELVCKNCNTIHRLGNDTTELNPCCIKPTFIKEEAPDHE